MAMMPRRREISRRKESSPRIRNRMCLLTMRVQREKEWRIIRRRVQLMIQMHLWKRIP